MPWPKGVPHTTAMKAKQLATRQRNGKRRKHPDGEGRWKCGRCQKWLLSSEFFKDKRAPNGLTSQCKTCHTECAIRTRDVENTRRLAREGSRRFRANNLQKARAKERIAARKRPTTLKTVARAKLNAAVRAGRIVRPTICPGCNLKKRITGHHDDYAKPLDVVWFCDLCHARHEREKRKGM